MATTRFVSAQGQSRVKATSRANAQGRVAVTKGTTTVFLNGVDLTQYVKNQALNVKLNSCDFVLVDPPSLPSLGDTINVDVPIWTGAVTSYEVTDNDISNHKFVKITATNTADALASMATSDLRDTTNDYRNLVVTRTINNGVSEIRGSLETFKAGFLPGQTFNLYSVTHGFAPTNFSITDVEVNWFKRTTPVYKITFGDAIVTMSVWVNSLTDAAIDNIFPIDETRITDGAVTTPKLAANAVTAEKIAAGEITADKLAATLILASLIKTADSGNRVEIDDSGIRCYAADETLLVNIPTDGSDVYINAETVASTLTVTGAAELRGTNTLTGSSVTTLAAGVQTPTSAPTLLQTLDSLTLGTISHPAHGVSYDSTAGTYWIGADPSSGSNTDVAYEINATTGAVIRTIQKSSTTTTTTKTLGSTSHVAESGYWTGVNTLNQVAYGLTMPEDGTITQVGAWFAGKDADVSAKLCVWSSGGTLLGQSAAFTATGKSYAVGASVQYTKSLTTPISATSGTTYYVGFSRDPAGASQFDRDNNTSVSFRWNSKTGSWPGSMSGYSTDYDSKPNVYLKYSVTVDSSLEGTMGTIVGVCRVGSYVWVLDSNGMLFQYNQSDLSYVGKTDMTSRIAYEAGAGLFYDGTNICIVTATGTTGTDQVRLVKLTTGGVFSSYFDTTGNTINGASATTRGGALVTESSTYYWIVVNGSAYAYNNSTGANIANSNFGSSTELGSGVTHNGTQFVGWYASTPTKLNKFSGWDWTTTSALYWVGYAWYDSAGTTHETAISPRSSITMNRRHRLLVTTPAIPTGGVDDPNNVRVYMLPSASAPSTGTFWLQATGTGTSRTLTSYTSSGTNDGAGTAFPSSVSAEIKSSISAWSLKGDGSATFGNIRTTGLSTFHGSISATIDADQNDWAPTGIHTAYELQIGGLTATRTITGISAASENGEMLWLHNNSSNDLVLAYESASSAAANRFRCPAGSALTVRAHGSVLLIYSTSRWRVVSP